MNERYPHNEAAISRYWECAECGRPSTEYTDQVICYQCATGDDAVSDAVRFDFFSDTNQKLALEELQLLSLDDMVEDTFAIYIGQSDYGQMQDSIDAIMDSYGAQIGV